MDLNVFLTPMKILKGFGLWQNKNASRFYAAYGIFMFFIYIGLSTLFQSLYIIDITSSDQLLDFLIHFPSFVSIFIKSLVFIARIDKIEDLLASMQELMAKVKSADKYKRQTRFIGRFFNINLISGLIATLLAAYTSFALQELELKMWLPFNIHDNYSLFVLVATISNVTVFGFVAVGVCLNVFADFFLNYAAIVVEDLCERFASQQVHDKKKDFKVENRKRFLQLIEEHRKIKQLIQEMANIFNPIWLMEGLTCSIVLCAISYTLSNVSNANLYYFLSTYLLIFSFQSFNDFAVFIKLFVYLILLLFIVFLPCYYGSRITGLSTKLSAQLFHSELHVENRVDRKLIIILMENLKKPIKISIVGVFEVNLETFVTLINFAYSLFAFFTRINGK